MASAGKGQSRIEFLQELFQKNPDVNEKGAAQAWQDAGYEGTISPSSFYSIKREIKGGGSVSAAAPSKPKAKPASKKPKPATAHKSESKSDSTATHAPAAKAASGGRVELLDKVEDGIDDLIVELKQLGGMDEALESLRKVRRVVVRSHGG